MNPFWPTKATEWVALFGGVLGTAAFVLTVLNYRRDRAKLHFRFDPRAPNHFHFHITNVGRRAARLAYGDVEWINGVTAAVAPLNRSLDSILLAEQDTLLLENIDGSYANDFIFRVVIVDAANKQYAYYPKPGRTVRSARRGLYLLRDRWRRRHGWS